MLHLVLTQAQLANRRGGKVAATANQTSGAAPANAARTVCKQAEAACCSAWEDTEAADASAQAFAPKLRSAEGGCSASPIHHEVLCEQENGHI